jgi:hypothetical protein
MLVWFKAKDLAYKMLPLIGQENEEFYDSKVE